MDFGPHKINKFERRRMMKSNLKNNNHSFTVNNFSPRDTFGDIRKFTHHAAIQKGQNFNFYFKGLRLPLSMTMSSFLSRFATNTLQLPILIYPQPYCLLDLPSSALLAHFAITYLPSRPHIYDTDIIHQTIEYEREKLRRLKEIFLLSLKSKNWTFFFKDFLEYLRRVLLLQKNVMKMKQENKTTIKLRGWRDETVVGGMGYKIENVWRWMCLIDWIEEDDGSKKH